MLERIYVEIGNICNLSCSFCPGTSKAKRQMSEAEFAAVCEKIKGHTKNIYLHVMGEPLLHPKLDGFLKIAKENGLSVCITTNGVLLGKTGQVLLDNSKTIHKISISLHALEGNGRNIDRDYLKIVSDFAKEAALRGIFVVMRLWNQDSAEEMGKNTQNAEIEAFLQGEFDAQWQLRPRGYRLAKFIFLEYDGVFTWPSDSKAEKLEEGFCHGLSGQAAILADGTVVPCCLDANGQLELGNIFRSSMGEILESPRARAILEGFASGKIVEPMCQTCTFARRFKIR